MRERRKPTVRSITCRNHEWHPLFSTPQRDAALAAEYERSGWADYQRCERCQRISCKRWDYMNVHGKHYTDMPRVFTLEESLKMMGQTVHPWNQRVAKTEQGRAVHLIFGKIVLDFASADDTPICNGTPSVETNPDQKPWEEHYKRIPSILRVDNRVKNRLYDTARMFYRDLDEEVKEE